MPLPGAEVKETDHAEITETARPRLRGCGGRG